MATPNFQQFSAVHQHVKAAKTRSGLSQISGGFPFVLLPLLVDVREDEVEATITDNSFQESRGKPGGHDRGTDAIVIDSDGSQSGNRGA
jgi:hypothetical protein